MAKEFKLTRLAMKELEDQLNYLRTVREKEVAEQIKEARSFGDLSENSEYDEAKNEQAKLYGQIAEIENTLANAVIIEETEEMNGHVVMGSTVRVRDLDTDEVELYCIVGTKEANPMEQRVSDESPFGKAILGKAVGDIFAVEAPVGTLRYEILSVEK